MVVALNLEGAFGKVWHAAPVMKLRAASMNRSLLILLETYLRDRHFKVAVDGQDFRPQPIRAGGPKGSCLGLLFCDIFINYLLYLIPSARAYADNLTLLSLCYKP